MRIYKQNAFFAALFALVFIFVYSCQSAASTGGTARPVQKKKKKGETKKWAGILDFNPGRKVLKKDIASLRSAFYIKLLSLQKENRFAYNLNDISREQMQNLQRVIAEIDKGTCTTTVCFSKIARALAVDYVISGKVENRGSRSNPHYFLEISMAHLSGKTVHKFVKEIRDTRRLSEAGEEAALFLDDLDDGMSVEEAKKRDLQRVQNRVLKPFRVLFVGLSSDSYFYPDERMRLENAAREYFKRASLETRGGKKKYVLLDYSRKEIRNLTGNKRKLFPEARGLCDNRRCLRKLAKATDADYMVFLHVRSRRDAKLVFSSVEVRIRPNPLRKILRPLPSTTFHYAEPRLPFPESGREARKKHETLEKQIVSDARQAYLNLALDFARQQFNSYPLGMAPDAEFFIKRKDLISRDLSVQRLRAILELGIVENFSLAKNKLERFYYGPLAGSLNFLLPGSKYLMRGYYKRGVIYAGGTLALGRQLIAYRKSLNQTHDDYNTVSNFALLVPRPFINLRLKFNFILISTRVNELRSEAVKIARLHNNTSLMLTLLYIMSQIGGAPHEHAKQYWARTNGSGSASVQMRPGFFMDVHPDQKPSAGSKSPGPRDSQGALFKLGIRVPF